MKVGVLALQGDVEEHERAFRAAAEELGVGVEVVRVKEAGQLRDIKALAIPGGESTAIGSLARRVRLLDELKGAIEGGLPTLGTCAGAIFMAKEVRDSVVGETKQPILGVMDIAVLRNAFGRQADSFEADLSVEGLGVVRAVFIRAPAITKAWGSAKPLAYVDHPKLGRAIAAAQEGAMFATAFHPELTTTLFHKALLEAALGRR